jgi:hypothetical protein
MGPEATETPQQRVYVRTSLIQRRLAEISSILVWSYLFIKVFVYDFDSRLVKTYIPKISWVIEYKLFVFLAVVVLLLFLLGTKMFLKLVGFIAIYPLFLFIWRLPKLLFGNKNWMGLFLALGTSVSFFRSFRLNMAISTAVLLAGLLILISSSKNIVFVSMGILFLYLLLHFSRRFSHSLKKFDVINKMSIYILDLWTSIRQSTGEPSTPEQTETAGDIIKREEARANRLQWLLVLNKVCLFLISKLRYIQKGASTIFYYFLNLAGSIITTIGVFAFLNLGLYRVYHASFSYQPGVRFIDFIFYSFGLFFSGIDSGISAIGDFAKALAITEICFRWLVVVVLAYYFLNIVKKKHLSDIETSIIQLREQGSGVEQIIRCEYHLSVDEALREVERARGSMLVLISYFVSHIDIGGD